MPTFTIVTLGCKVNRCESEGLAQQLIQSGYTPAADRQTTDLCIINTCAVTQKAAMQSRQAIRQIERTHPAARIVVTGCYAQIDPQHLKKIQGIDFIVGHTQKHRIVEIITPHSRKLPDLVCIHEEVGHERQFQDLPLSACAGRTRPFLKIQDGCDAFCTYCIVPYARGRSRSMPVAAVLAHLGELAANGYREAVLTGIHLGCYGLDLPPPTSLLALMGAIESLDPIHRLRLSSIEPFELTPPMVRLVARSKMFCPHFHIPLQSGDDDILKRMQRPYTRSDFRTLVNDIHHCLPDAAIGLDILIGFPGETQRAFENTYDLVAELPVTYLHVFPFSARPGTPASRYPRQVPSAVIKARCQEMRRLGQAQKIAFFKRQVGKTVQILVEEVVSTDGGGIAGLSGNYLPVRARSRGRWRQNDLVSVRIDSLQGASGVKGTICQTGP